MPEDQRFLFSLFAAVSGGVGFWLLSVARAIAREQRVGSGEQPPSLPLNKRWIEIGLAALSGLFCLYLFGACLLELCRPQ